MKEELASPKLSKLAKEKGFDWAETRVLRRRPYYNHLGVLNGDELDYIKAYVKEMKGGESCEALKSITAPTLSLLQKWVREVHLVHITVYCTTKKKYFYGLESLLDICKRVVNSVDDVFYDTFEEALEAGLLQYIKTIK